MDEIKCQDEVITYYYVRGTVIEINKENDEYLVNFPGINRSAWYGRGELTKVTDNE